MKNKTDCEMVGKSCPSDEQVEDLLEPCSKPTFIESRMVYTPSVCQPRVKGGGDGPVLAGIGGQACNLLKSTPGGLVASAGFSPDADGVLTFSGCGTAENPWRPSIDYGALALKIIPSDPTNYVTEEQCGWKWSEGRLVTRGRVIFGIKSSNNSVTAKYDPETCEYDVSVVKDQTQAPLDAPAEIGIVQTNVQSVLGNKQVTVEVKHVKSGSTGTVSVQPNLGPAPAPQNYTANATGVAVLTFALDSSSTQSTVAASNSSRYLVFPSQSVTIPC